MVFCLLTFFFPFFVVSSFSPFSLLLRLASAFNSCTRSVPVVFCCCFLFLLDEDPGDAVPDLRLSSADTLAESSSSKSKNQSSIDKVSKDDVPVPDISSFFLICIILARFLSTGLGSHFSHKYLSGKLLGSTYRACVCSQYTTQRFPLNLMNIALIKGTNTCFIYVLVKK